MRPIHQELRIKSGLTIKNRPETKIHEYALIRDEFVDPYMLVSARVVKTVSVLRPGKKSLKTISEQVVEFYVRLYYFLRFFT